MQEAGWQARQAPFEQAGACAMRPEPPCKMEFALFEKCPYNKLYLGHLAILFPAPLR